MIGPLPEDAQPQPNDDMVPRFTNPHWCATALLGLLLAAPFCSTFAVLAGEVRAPGSLDTIVVQGKRLPESVPDEELQQQVRKTLHDDPFFYDEHVTVTVTNGVVHLEGIVLDASDIKDVLRIIKKKFPGAKRVINELEICREDSDDG
jgi:hypothetical protein